MRCRVRRCIALRCCAAPHRNAVRVNGPWVAYCTWVPYSGRGYSCKRVYIFYLEVVRFLYSKPRRQQYGIFLLHIIISVGDDWSKVRSASDPRSVAGPDHQRFAATVERQDVRHARLWIRSSRPRICHQVILYASLRYNYLRRPKWEPKQNFKVHYGEFYSHRLVLQNNMRIWLHCRNRHDLSFRRTIVSMKTQTERLPGWTVPESPSRSRKWAVIISDELWRILRNWNMILRHLIFVTDIQGAPIKTTPPPKIPKSISAIVARIQANFSDYVA